MASLADSTAWPQDSSSRAGCPDPPGAGESPIGRGSISPGSGARPRPVRVIQARPPEEPTTTAGITSEDPGESGSKAKLPNAIGPVPQPPTRLSITASPKRPATADAARPKRSP